MPTKTSKTETKNLLTLNYLEEHSAHLHTYESFSRSLVAQSFKEACTFIKKNGNKKSIILNAKIVIDPSDLLNCIRFTVVLRPGVEITRHIPVEQLM